MLTAPLVPVLDAAAPLAVFVTVPTVAPLVIDTLAPLAPLAFAGLVLDGEAALAPVWLPEAIAAPVKTRGEAVANAPTPVSAVLG